MPDFKAGPLSSAELQALWESSVDKSYSKPFIAAGEGNGFEAWTQLFRQYERASKAIDVTTQAMFISPWSGQTNPPAAGAAKATVTLSFSRTKFLERGLVLGKGLIYVGEVATDFGENGPEEVETGRRYVLKEDLVFFPGDMGPLEVEAEAERPGYGYNNPLPETIRLISQPGAVFENNLATVAQTAEVASPEGTRSRASILAAAEPDMFVPEHVGQYVYFRDGANPGKIGRITTFTAPDTTVLPNLGSKAGLELFCSIEATAFAGTFEVGEIVAIGGPATAYGRVLAERSAGGVKKLAFVLLNGTGIMVGAPLSGASSGATATIRSVMDQASFVAEAPTAGVGGASWRMLDWSSDFGLTVTHEASPEGGRSAMLDELGFERGIRRVPGEDDESYRVRVREPADVVSPNAVRRALNRALGSYPWVLREVGLAELPGFFFDGDMSLASTTPHGAQNDAYDYDTIAILGEMEGTFDFQEEVQIEQDSTDLVFLSGWLGRETPPTPSVFNLAWDRGAWDYTSYSAVHRVATFIRRNGTFPKVDGSVFRVRGLRSGALITFPHNGSNVEYSKQWPTRRYRCYLDYEQFRGFFMTTVQSLANGEFGTAYDADAWDVVAKGFDGFPADASEIYLRAWRGMEGARAGGVATAIERTKPIEVLADGIALPPAVDPDTLEYMLFEDGDVMLFEDGDSMLLE